MRAFLARDRDGVLKCFYKESPTRHLFSGTWESKPKSKKEYFIIPDEEQTAEHLSIQWEQDPREVRMLLTNRRVLWR